MIDQKKRRGEKRRGMVERGGEGKEERRRWERRREGNIGKRRERKGRTEERK